MSVLEIHTLPENRAIALSKGQRSGAAAARQQYQTVLVGQRVAGIAEFQTRSAELPVNIVRPDWPPRFLVKGMDLADSTRCNQPVSDDLRHRVRARPDPFGIRVLKNGFVGVLPQGLPSARVERRDDIL